MSLAPIVHELRLACPVEVAFDTYVDRIAEWWPPGYTDDAGSFSGLVVEPVVGGRVVASHGADEKVWGRVTLWERATHLAHTFTPGQPPGRAWRGRGERGASWCGPAVR
ncbi:MAG: hypothetical protein ACTHNI_03915, partial [Cellulosimicrobium cellulans]